MRRPPLTRLCAAALRRSRLPSRVERASRPLDGPRRLTYVGLVRKRFDLQQFIATYGPTGIVVYLLIFALTILGFFFAIRAGFQIEGTAENTGTLFAAWLAAKVTQPVRIVATAVVTPVVVRFMRGRREASRATPEGDRGDEV